MDIMTSVSDRTFGLRRCGLMLALVIAILTARAEDFVKNAAPAELEVRYERVEVLDTTRDGDDRKAFVDRTMLRMGGGMSLFCCIPRLMRDSLMAVNPALYWEMEKVQFEKDPKGFSSTENTLQRIGAYNSYVYKNYPEGKVTEASYFDMERRLYEEDWEKPDWEITDETKEVIGYECFKATTEYRGRTWTAWFAPEIPVQDGPWKLCGLPGLILEAHDKNKDYQFTATSLFVNPDAQIGYFTYSDRRGVTKTSRDKYFNSWWKYTNSNFGEKMNSMYGKGPKPSEKRKTKPHHDKEETDYPHDL